MIGTIISRCELQARWSYAEVTGRFADTYRKNHTDSASVALLTKIADGAAFADLTHTDRDMLVGWFETGLRKDYAGKPSSSRRTLRGADKALDSGHAKRLFLRKSTTI
jgi:hypothetical protein